MALSRLMPLWSVGDLLAGNSYDTYSLDTSVKGAGVSFLAPKTGNISKLSFYCSAAAGSPVLDCRLETVGSTWLPTGTLKGTNSNGSATITAAGFYNVSFTTACAVNQNDALALVINAPGDASGSKYATIGDRMNFSQPNLPYYLRKDTTWVYGGSRGPNISGEYDDGSPAIPRFGVTDNAGQFDWANAASSNRYGIRFTPTYSMSVYGLVVFCYGSFKGKIWCHKSDGTLIASGSMPNTELSTYYDIWAMFDSVASLVAGTEYYLTVDQNAGAGNVALYKRKFASDAQSYATLGEVVNGVTWNGSTWSTNSDVYFFTPIVDWASISSGGGGGLLIGGGMTGGFHRT